MQLSETITLLPIEPAYTKKIGKDTVVSLLMDELQLSFDEATSYVNGSELTKVIEMSSLIRLSMAGIPIYFIAVATIVDCHLKLPRSSDTFQILEENAQLELSLGDFILPLTTELSLIYLGYTTVLLLKKVEEPITIRVKLGLWPPSIRCTPYHKRKAYGEIVYYNGEPVYGPGISGIRPSCLDVWTTHIEEKYFNKWRRALRVIKARRFRDVNAAIPWMPKCPLGLNYEYKKLIQEQLTNEQKAIAYRKTGIFPDIRYSNPVEQR